MSNSVITTIDVEKQRLSKECDELIKRLRDKAGVTLPEPTPMPSESIQEEDSSYPGCPF